MADNRNRKLMQEALDNNLPPDMRQKLFKRLDKQPDEAAEYGRLRQIDAILKTAPLERAPARLALSIMARLAEGVKAQPGISGLALAVALSLVTLVALPLLLAAGWLAVSVLASATLLSDLFQRLVGLMSVLVNLLHSFLQEAQHLVETHPEAPALAAALVGLAVAGIVGYAYINRKTS